MVCIRLVSINKIPTTALGPLKFGGNSNTTNNNENDDDNYLNYTSERKNWFPKRNYTDSLKVFEL